MINLIVKTGKTSPTNDGFLSCLAVAFTLLAMICIAGSKSGACLNPAVGIAQTIFEIAQYGNDITSVPTKQTYVNSEFSDYFWLYTSAPFIGSILAGFAHRTHLVCYDRVASSNTAISKLID
jgi:glycerol uptake facilitator-like aquaporin